eukprot:scaffold4712_cov80-Skeletonema_menzelii.AAC.2
MLLHLSEPVQHLSATTSNNAVATYSSSADAAKTSHSWDVPRLFQKGGPLIIHHQMHYTGEKLSLCVK